MSLVVFDLDGTLLKGNSFHLFLLWLVRSPRSGLRTADRLAVIGLVLARALRSIDHAQMKRRVLELPAAAMDVRDFAAGLVADGLSPGCVARLRQHQQAGDLTVLATAAPARYAQALGDLMAFHAVVATPAPAPGERWRETLREEKLGALRRLFPGVDIAATYTDHVDDAPLLRVSARRILVNPSATTAAALQELGCAVDETICDRS